MRYLVEPAFWYPEDALSALKELRRCCVGVSVGQPAFRGRRLLSLLGWLQSTCESVLFLVGDHILRHTIALETGVEREAAAVAAALDRGRCQIQAIANAARIHPSLKVEILPISAIIHTPEYSGHRAWIENLHQTNSAFSQSLTRTAEQYLRTYSSQGRRISVDPETAVYLCKCYLMEEIASFSVIHEWGWMIDVYPGPELPVLLEIAEGRYPEVPEFLQNRISISLEHVRQASALQFFPEERYASFASAH